MALLHFKRRENANANTSAATDAVAAFLSGHSLEVMPRTAAKIDDFRPLLAPGSEIYIAHIEGTPIEDMLATAARLHGEGFRVTPHFPARLIKDRATLGEWIDRYRAAADIDSALVLAGGVAKPVGAFADSMQLLDTGLFERAGIRRLRVAGHPEGSRDIDPDGSMKNVSQALVWKQQYSIDTSAEMAIVTQFAFEAAPIIKWVENLAEQGITLPVHIGIAGPAKLQTLIRFAIACGVGPSLKVLQKRAMDVTKLLLPYEPTQIVTELATHKAQNPDFAIQKAHFFPLGGIGSSTKWARAHGGDAPAPNNPDKDRT